MIAQATVTTTRTAKDPNSMTDSVDTKQVDVPAIHARVSVTAGQTVNMGNYETVRISVSVDYPCALPEVNATYDMLKEFVQTKLGTEVESLREIRAKVQSTQSTQWVGDI